MYTFMVSVTRKIEADTAEEAALLLYQELARGAVPTSFSVADEANVSQPIELDRTKADEFAALDHTADPGNW